MRDQTRELTVVTAGAPVTGPEFLCAEHRDKVVQVQGTFTAGLEIWARVGSASLAPYITGITGPGFYSLPDALTAIAVRCVSYGTGTPRVFFGGQMSRSD